MSETTEQQGEGWTKKGQPQEPTLQQSESVAPKCRICGSTVGLLPDPAGYHHDAECEDGAPLLHAFYAWAMTPEQRIAHGVEGDPRYTHYWEVAR